jgi:hypothetical protein
MRNAIIALRLPQDCRAANPRPPDVEIAISFGEDVQSGYNGSGGCERSSLPETDVTAHCMDEIRIG